MNHSDDSSTKNPERLKPMITQSKKCSIQGCHATAAIKGMCGRHYNRWIYRRMKDLPAGDCPDGWPCPICGERLGNLATHMSKHHGIGLKEYYRRHNVRCSVPGCERLAEVRGMCRMHRRQEREDRL